MPSVPKGRPPKWHATIPGADKVEAIYHTSKWQKYRAWFLKENPVCVQCEKLSNVVDHIIPARQKPNWFWRTTNHQALCDSCHNKKRAGSDMY